MAKKKTVDDRKTILITGGGSGIGLETARFLLRDPEFKVVLLGKHRNKLEATAKALAKDLPSDKKSDDQRGGQRLGISVCDLADENQIKKTFEKILSIHKSLYGLVNNAGIYPFGGVADTTSKQWDDTMMVNLKAPFLLTQLFSEQFKKVQGDGSAQGRIVNVSSTAGLLPNHFALAYSVSKAAMIQLTRTTAKELGKLGITVNCVCPGIVKTPLHESYHSSNADLETFYQKRGAAFPMGRVGEPKDIAHAIRYFLSPEASWVTGDVLVIDGGRLLL